MPIRILAIGKKHEPWVTDGINRYQKRLQRPFQVKWDILPHSTLAEHPARQNESERILTRLHASDFVILLDETGSIISSPELSELLGRQLSQSMNIVIIIGGAYGVDATIKNRADFVWSLSKLVFPHQLVRLVLTEQLYRAQEIAHNGPYHHA
ncbi:23S rRNA (pseudouridine(1915)-N(3))-methyltransferase RlmH [Candidatus Saccharibacteria bacterium]|nr:23S rRNA (pseudouridine(1915)-N(3))-methyltransferase RlmH [Candidatus Saccharibacteria bacterium]